MGYIYRDFPELSWSISRLNSLEQCKRGYFYNYYLSHNGWDLNADENHKKAFLLKKLSNKDILCGSIVHKAIKYLISQNNKGTMINEDLIDYITERGINKFKNCCSDSEKYGSSWNRQQKDFEMLREYFYNRNLTTEDKLYIETKISKCINSAMNSNTFKYIQSNNVKILELDLEDFTFFYINGIKVYVKLDLLYIDSNGKYVVVDWKTGKEDIDNELQLAVYAKYVSEKYNVNISDIICKIEYLNSNTFTEKVFTDEEINDLDFIINSSMNEMQTYLADKSKNQAKDITSFNMTNDVYKCNNCNFYNLCYSI